MLVVLASQHDQAARDLVVRWSDAEACLVTPADLSRAGWRHTVSRSSAGGSRAVVDGRVVAAEAIRGVLTRLPCVVEGDLPHVDSEDRAYVAAEMTAFLVAWLAVLPRPVLNRPRDGSLAGPTWRRARWLRMAAALGIPVRADTLHATFATVDPQPDALAELRGAATVTVVGQHALGDAHPLLLDHARRLASAASASVLNAHFSSPDAPAELLSVDVWPNVGSPPIADAILDHLLTASGAC